MKCPKCGSTLHSFDGCMVGCDNEKCYYRKHFTEYASTLEAGKEKVEAELQVIKDIWADGEYMDNARKTIKYLKQIGGVK